MPRSDRRSCLAGSLLVVRIIVIEKSTRHVEEKKHSNFDECSVPCMLVALLSTDGKKMMAAVVSLMSCSLTGLFQRNLRGGRDEFCTLYLSLSFLDSLFLLGFHYNRFKDGWTNGKYQSKT